MSAAPTISVVVPCFNAERYIATAIESVLKQDWPSLEVIVVDDGSTDGSAERVRGLCRAHANVRLFEQANAGVAAARNHGLRQASGEWIAFLDADDLWLPGKLQAQWSLLQSRPDARMAYTAWQVWESAEPVPDTAYLTGLLAEAGCSARWSGPSGWIYADLLLDSEVWTSTVLTHRGVFDEIGVFDPSLRIGEDWDLWLRASRVTPILRVPRPYALYRMHPSNITRRAPDQNFTNVVISRALARWGYDSPDGSSASKAAVDSGLARSWSDFAGANLLAGHVTRARHGALMALRASPRHLSGWKMLAKTMLRSIIARPPTGG